MPSTAHAVPTDSRIKNPVVVLILTLITCGLYGLVWLWQVETDLKTYLGKDDMSPGLDVVLTVLTLGLWLVFLMYRTPELVLEAQRKAELPPRDIRLPSVLLAALGFPWVSFVLIQVELNKVWGAAPAP